MFVLLPPANEVWGKVMFSRASVIPSVHRGVCLLGGLYPVGAAPLPREICDTVNKWVVRILPVHGHTDYHIVNFRQSNQKICF